MPKGAGMVPVAIIDTVIDDGLKRTDYHFQVNFAELEEIIVNLQACQKEMRLMESVLANVEFDKA